MLNIAIAGGNGAIGKTILRALREEAGNQYRPFILTRKKQDPTNEDEIEVPYRNVDGLRKVLEQHAIHTIVCTFDMTPRGLGVSQLNLIKAAELSSCTKRFIPTGYAVPYARSLVQVLPPLKEHFACVDELDKSGLEWTQVVCGMFLDYYGMPKVDTELKKNVVAVDVEHRAAAIPGTGDVPVTFTYTHDLARFVVRLLDLAPGSWEKEERVIGDTVTWKEFLRLAQEMTGERFEVVFDSMDKLKKFQVTELPGHYSLYGTYPKERLQWFLSIFELMTADGTSCLQRRGSLNERFPDIKTTSVRDMLETCWGQRR